MRIRILTLLIVLLSWGTMAQQEPEEILDAYLSIRSALVQDDFNTSEKNAERLVMILKKSDDFKQKDELIKYAEQVKNATTIEGQRKGFAQVSGILWSWMKKQPSSETILYYQYCPMKKAYWISDKTDIENPYYGKSMLRCGSISEKR